MSKILEVNNLNVSFDTASGEIPAVHDVSFDVNEGEIYGIVGESGSGKSVSMKTIMRLNPSNGRLNSGTVRYKGTDIISLSDAEFLTYRGREFGMIFQDSLTALNPVYTVGEKLVELIMHIRGLKRKEARVMALENLKEVGINDAERCFNSYPHELSGGMRQRVMIAMVLVCEPKLIVADEPTTSLDVTIQAQILKLLKKISLEKRVSVILITHDFGAVAQLCGRISVMCGGYIVETGTAEDIFLSPGHPYTKALIASIPSSGREFEALIENDSSTSSDASLCPFLGRCKYANEKCRKSIPEMRDTGSGHSIRCWILYSN